MWKYSLSVAEISLKDGARGGAIVGLKGARKTSSSHMQARMDVLGCTALATSARQIIVALPPNWPSFARLPWHGVSKLFSPGIVSERLHRFYGGVPARFEGGPLNNC